MIVIPENKLITIPENINFINSNELIIEPLKGKLKRDWFVNHAYFCLPLVIGNQYGFAIKSLKTFSVIWDGGDTPNNTIIEILDEGDNPNYLPIPRYFVDGFELQNGYDVFTAEEIQEEQQIMHEFGIERSTKDIEKPNGNGRRYFNGEDVRGCPFHNHQKKI